MSYLGEAGGRTSPGVCPEEIGLSTRRRLYALDIRFSERWHAFSPEALEISAKGSITQGILFTGGGHKGHCLVEVLQRMPQRPEKIIFIDDLSKSVTEAQEALVPLSIPYVGIRYSKMDAQVASLDPQVCERQLAAWNASQSIAP